MGSLRDVIKTIFCTSVAHIFTGSVVFVSMI